jgi:hypothetical protein
MFAFFDRLGLESGVMTTTIDSVARSFTSFGLLLHYLRKRARLTQRDLAVAVGYSASPNNAANSAIMITTDNPR